MKRFAGLFFLAAVALCLPGCNPRNTFGIGTGGQKASIPQSLLASVPCVRRAVEVKFNVTPVVVEDDTTWTVSITVNLPPAGKQAVQVRYAMWSYDGRTTLVRYSVDAPEALRQRLLLDAFDPVEECAGVRGTGQ
jgi:hypothetical protein